MACDGAIVILSIRRRAGVDDADSGVGGLVPACAVAEVE